MTINEFKDLLRKVINVPGAIAEMDTIGAFIPDGLICMWSGSEVPNGWLLCDGTNGTPDLADKFVLGGAIADIGTTAAQQDTVVDNHSAHAAIDMEAAMAGSIGSQAVATGAGATVPTMETVHSWDGDLNHSAHSVVTQYFPPYYQLAYIMKGVAA